MESILIIFIALSTLILFQTYSIAHILLIAICNFFLSSALIAYNGHIFIASIFLIVYTGAILVMICVAYLLTPSIQKKKNKKNLTKNQSDTINIIFFNFFIILFISTIILIELKDNSEFVLDLSRNNHIFEDTSIPTIFDKMKEYAIKLEYQYQVGSFEMLILNLSTPVSTGRAIFESPLIDSHIIDLSNIILQTFQTIQTINYTNTVSYIYTKHPLSFLSIGIYLLLTLLICLRIFIIMAKSIIIKRQDIIDQILKIWKK